MVFIRCHVLNFFQKLQLFFSGSFQNRLDTVKKIQNAGNPQVIEYLVSMLAVMDNPGVFKKGKVLGDGGNVGTNQGGQFANTFFSVRKLIDNNQSRGVSHGFDYFRPGFEQSQLF